MIRAYHAVFTAYGFWLPNDPRGSWSDFVGSWELFRFGPATKAKATAQLNRDGRHPLAAFRNRRGDSPTPWAAKRWRCFLNCDEEILRAIRYVEENPVKEGKRRQRWSFVAPWPG